MPSSCKNLFVVSTNPGASGEVTSTKPKKLSVGSTELSVTLTQRTTTLNWSTLVMSLVVSRITDQNGASFIFETSEHLTAFPINAINFS